MKIYYDNDEGRPSFYFMTWKENGLFSFSLEVPNMNTLQLWPCTLSPEIEEKVWNEAVQIPEELNHEFNLLYRQKNNYEGISRILLSVFNVDQDTIDKAYDRNLELAGIVKEAIDSTKNRWYSDNWYFSELYRKGHQYLKIWNGDRERIKKYMVEHDIPKLNSHDMTMVDIWGEMHPTKRMLLYEFHDSWGDRLNKIIDKAVEKYPGKDDFDLAFYYARDKVRDRNYGYDDIIKKHKQDESTTQG